MNSTLAPETIARCFALARAAAAALGRATLVIDVYSALRDAGMRDHAEALRLAQAAV